MTAMELAGYFPKDTTLPEHWTACAAVQEICSVSTCIAHPPEGWIERWLHNDLGFFNSAADARSAIPSETVRPSAIPRFTLFAYRLLPMRFDEGKSEALPATRLTVEPLPGDFVPLGFDVVSKSSSAFFECSPLSCNNLAAEVPVNRFCLLETLPEAIRFAERCSREHPEPGAYYVLEVLRGDPHALR